MSLTVAELRRERPTTGPAAERGGAGVSRRVAFWLLALVFAATMLGTTLPTPLYVIYQARWHFSSAMVTVTFAVYAAGVLAALLLAGRSSDQAGRKPVLAAALGLSALSTAAFAAFSLLGLFAALAPTFLGNVLHEDNHAVQGAVVFLLFAAGTAIQLLLSRFPSRRIMVAGLGLLLPALAPPGRRGQIVSTYFVACYGGLIVPVVGVGIASGFIGDFPAVLALSVLLAALCLVALAGVGRTHAPDGTMVSR